MFYFIASVGLLIAMLAGLGLTVRMHKKIEKEEA